MISSQLMMNFGAFGLGALAIAGLLWGMRSADQAKSRQKKLRGELDKIRVQHDALSERLGKLPCLCILLSHHENDGNSLAGELLFGSARLTKEWIGQQENFFDPIRQIANRHWSKIGGDQPGFDHRLHHLIDAGNGFELLIEDSESGSFLLKGTTIAADPILFLFEISASQYDKKKNLPLAAKPGAYQKRFEKHAQSQALLNAISSSVPSWLVGPQGEPIWHSEAYRNWLANKSEAKDGHNGFQWLSPQLESLTKRALETKQSITHDGFVIAGSKRRYCRMHLLPVEHGVYGFVQDLDDLFQKRAISEHKLQSLQSAMAELDIAIAIFDEKKRLTFYNQALAHIWQLPEVWLDQTPSHAAFLDRLQAEEKLPFRPDFPEWKSGQLELYQAQEKPTDEIWHLPGGSILSIAYHQPIEGGLICIFRDITDRVELQSMNSTLTRVQRVAFDQLSDGVLVFGQGGRMKLANESFLKLWQLERSDLPEGVALTRVRELLRPLCHDLQFWEDLSFQIMGNLGERQDQILRIKRSDGALFNVVLKPLPDGDIMAIFSDITASVTIQNALEQRNRSLAETDQIRSSFVRHVSKHLREPLTTIQGYAQLLSMSSQETSQQKNQSGHILTASRDLSRLIDNIIDYATLDAGQLKLSFELVEILPLIHDAVKIAGADLQSTSFEIRVVEPPSELPNLTLFGDPNRLQQILVQLLLNAMQHEGEGGLVEIGFDQDVYETRLWVADHGGGIDESRFENMFKPFEGSQSGAGLGLSLVRSFIELHHGWVEIMKNGSNGTKVICHLPVHQAEEMKSESPPAQNLSEISRLPD